MKMLVLYRPNSEHSRRVEVFLRDFKSRHGSEPAEIINIDTREGSAMATFYDVVQYPAILILQTDGFVVKMWQGETLPLIDEVAAYSTT